jgi:hypothetical protein
MVGASLFKSLKVVSTTRKFLAKVPKTHRVLEFPAEATVSKYGKGNDAPAIIVHNATDTSSDPRGTYQGAKVDQYILVNEVSEDAATAALAILGTDDFTIARLDATLEYLANAGFRDQYTSDLAFVSTRLSPAGTMLGDAAGHVKRDDRDVMDVFRKGDGLIYVSHGDREPIVIEPDILVRTYRRADGANIDLSEIPTIA